MGVSEPSRDWTTGPAKWAAVAALGAASLGGLAWSAFWRQPRPIESIPAAVAPPGGEAAASRPAVQPVPAPIVRPPPDPEPEAPRDAAPTQPPPREPLRPESRPAPPSPPRTINVNTAPAAELELLPGIGPALAARIVEYRATHGPFKSVDELDHVSGIGPRTLEKIRPHATVK